jgi:hypothetical protein
LDERRIAAAAFGFQRLRDVVGHGIAGSDQLLVSGMIRRSKFGIICVGTGVVSCVTTRVRRVLKQKVMAAKETGDGTLDAERLGWA